LVRWYPTSLAADKLGLAFRGVVEGHRDNATVAVTATLNGRALATWSEADLNADSLISAPFPALLEEEALVELAADYTLTRDGRQSPIGRTAVTAPADIDVESGPARARIRINNRTWGGTKGYTLAAIDPVSGAVEIHSFNTSWFDAASQDMAEYIGALPAGTVVAAATEYDASRHLTSDAVAALRTLGVSEDLRGRFEWAHAAIGVKGAAPGTAIESATARNAACHVGHTADLRLNLSELKLY
jgi:hypothetical protein